MSEGSGRIVLEVATPRGKALETEVDTVQVPGSEGEFGILPGHLPLLSTIKPGILRYYQGNQTHVAAVDTGFAEAGPGRVLILTEGFATPDKIDVDAVKLELAEADKKQAEFAEVHEGAEYDSIVRAQQWAGAQLEAAGRG